jgi:uncharacterized protein (DUF1810 family)
MKSEYNNPQAGYCCPLPFLAVQSAKRLAICPDVQPKPEPTKGATAMNVQRMPWSTGADPYNLQRFLSAQESTFDQVRAELQTGQKRSHWMWFIFPQIKGLGSSPTAQRFAISSLDEGAAYLEHQVLGRRLEACTALVLAVEGKSVHDIFGSPDDLKFHSSITLFAEVAEKLGFQTPVFSEALSKYFNGERDQATLKQLRS